MSSHSRRDDHRHSSSRRDSLQSSRWDRDSNRGFSSATSRGRSPAPPIKSREENELPEEFGRPPLPTSKEDENTVLRRMKTAFINSPLSLINETVNRDIKVKVWTRNYNEIRGVCTGIVIAFDKHWNLLLSDVNETYVKPRKTKTPYLLDIASDNDLPELKPKVPRVKKTKSKEEEEVEKEPIKEKEPSKKKKKLRPVIRRHHKQVYIRGDNVVTFAVYGRNNIEEYVFIHPDEINY